MPKDTIGGINPAVASIPGKIVKSRDELLAELIEQNRIIIVNQEELKEQNLEIIEKLCNLSSLEGYNED